MGSDLERARGALVAAEEGVQVDAGNKVISQSLLFGILRSNIGILEALTECPDPECDPCEDFATPDTEADCICDDPECELWNDIRNAADPSPREPDRDRLVEDWHEVPVDRPAAHISIDWANGGTTKTNLERGSSVTIRHLPGKLS